MITKFNKHGSLYYDGTHWYKPCVQDGKTVLEILSDDEAAKIVKEKDLYYGEIPD